MKKRIFSVLLAVLMVALLLPVQAFAETKEYKGAYVGQEYEMVIGNVVGAKTYSKSGNIPEGMKLAGSWAYKNTYGNYVFKMTLTGTPTKAGTYNFSVTYKQEDGKTVVSKIDYTITVGAKAPFVNLQSIYLEKWPTKTEYYLGDSVDLTGMKVTAVATIYDEKTKEYIAKEIDVTDLAWVEPAVFTSDEAQSVMVYVKAPNKNGKLYTFEDSFRVTFKYADAKDILRIEVYQKPTKLTYTEGEKLDTTGMTVRLHKGDGSAEDITEGFKTDVTTLSEVGTKTVTVTYGEGEKAQTATFDVTVNEKVEVPASSSSSSSVPETPSTSTSSAPETSSEPEVSVSEPETSSEPEVSVSEPEVSVSEPETSSEPEEIEVIGGEVEEPEENEKGGVPFWAWIIIGLLVILIAAAVALFLIGRKRIDD